MLMDEFVVFPAIDLRRGNVVRLRRGDAECQTTYGDDPGQVARGWIASGAKWLHVINLDGAFGEDTTANMIGLKSVLDCGAKIQFGGGLRSIESMAKVIEMGVERVILGTVTLEEPELVERAVEAFGEARIVVGIDARDGKVRVRGWTQGSEVDPLSIALRIRDQAVKTTVITDISRDGVDRGVNLDLAKQIAVGTGLSVIAAGGVNSIGDVQKAKELGLQGIIIGRALYEGQISLEEALSC
jgi:phosphoribosylformimino-5-aminoimidazole carboxamide ribotide isomerase